MHVLLQLRTGLTTCVQIAALAKCDQLFDDALKFFCLRQSCLDLLMFDERAGHVCEQCFTVFVCPVEAAVTTCVTHEKVSILYYDGPCAAMTPAPLLGRDCPVIIV